MVKAATVTDDWSGESVVVLGDIRCGEEGLTLSSRSKESSTLFIGKQCVRKWKLGKPCHSLKIAFVIV